MRRIILSLLMAGGFAVGGLAEQTNGDLRLATTTSVENSGLLNHLLPDFERRCRCRVRVLPVGSGKALELGRSGDVDLLLTHAPDEEKRFIAEGYGLKRQLIMHNHFVLLGSPTVALTARNPHDTLDIMRAIAEQKKRFVSRGDDSGTHKKEMSLWRQIPVEPRGDWYIESGAGMGQAIIMADELNAFVLSDIGTFLYFRDKVNLRIFAKDEPPLYNPYSIIPINPSLHEHVNAELAEQFTDWLLSADTQRAIAAYRVNGGVLFHPATAQ